MFKITGLDKLQNELKEAEAALSNLEGEFGAVTFDPDDPASIEAAIQSANQMIDERAGNYSSNSIIGPLAEQMKEQFREGILQKAAEARLNSDENE